jgi:hypothetical protein
VHGNLVRDNIHTRSIIRDANTDSVRTFTRDRFTVSVMFKSVATAAPVNIYRVIISGPFLFSTLASLLC